MISTKRVTLLLIIVSTILLSASYAANIILTSFNSGELSPQLGGRIDFAKYTSGVQTALNAVPLAQGGITRRPGTEYLGAASGAEGRLIPFVFSEDQAYVLEFEDNTMRVWADGGLVQTVDTATVLLLHFDDYDGSTTFTDSGTTVHTISATGDTNQDTSQKVFGQSSAYFDGDADHIGAADSADWFMDTGSFTIDFWIRPQSVTGLQGIFQQYQDATNYVNLAMNGTGLTFTIIDAGVTNFSVTDVATTYFALDTWVHIAIVRNSNTWTFYKDGVQTYSTTDSDDWPNLAAGIQIGSTGISGDFEGHIDEFRISKGSARWTANFTVPTFPYPTGDDSGITYMAATSYAEGDLDSLRYVQSADTLYLAHPDMVPKKLTRTAHDAWTFTNFNWGGNAPTTTADRWPPLQDINATATTLDASATTGANITITASSSFFSPGHVGSYFKMHDGLIYVHQYDSATQVTGNVVDELTAHTATADWYESSWSVYRGFPSTLTFFEQRLVFANNDNQPQTIWMTESGDYEDFIVNDTVTDDDAVTFTLLSEQINAIKWMVSDRRLLIGTTGGEWWLSGDTSENAVTPTSILVRNATQHGSGNVTPVKAGGSTIFVQRPGKTVRRFEYNFDSDSYQANNLSILAEHITEDTNIEEIVYQQQPHQLIWCRLSDGNLATLSYMPEHDIYAWARHELARTPNVKSLAVIPGATDDELWMIVDRTINSASVVYMERLHNFYFAPGQTNSVINAVYSDAAATYNGKNATTITGLDHLEGESVAVLADGVVVSGKTVSGGEITLTDEAEVVHVGLTYFTDIETMRLTGANQFAAIQGRLKRINKITARLYKTLSATAGKDSSNLETLQASFATEAEAELRIAQGRDTSGVVFFRQTQPGPMTILALMMDIEVY